MADESYTIADLPMKVDDIYRSKVNKGMICISSVLITDTSLKAGDVVNIEIRRIRDGSFFGPFCSTLKAYNTTLWPMQAPIPEGMNLEGGDKIYIRVKKLEIKEWFEGKRSGYSPLVKKYRTTVKKDPITAEKSEEVFLDGDAYAIVSRRRI